MKTLKVSLSERSYHIFIDSDNLDTLAKNLRKVFKGNKILLVTNPAILSLYQEQITKILYGYDYKITTVPDGEEAKSIAELERLYTVAIDAGLDRHSAVVAFGGGVVGDVTGFLAATLYRGVNFIQIPTTLLAQVDSSVGGKVAVNHSQGKNLIGAFYQPLAVFIDTSFLKTLPERELKCGLAEVLKYAFIKDPEFLEYLDRHVDKIYSLDTEVLENIIAISCRIKSQVVGEDEREANIRAILNFGHTIGHALEKIIGYGVIRHGEAVAVGMAQVLKISYNLKLLKEHEYEKMLGLIKKYDLPIDIPRGISLHSLLEAAATDKKAEKSLLTFVLLTGVGEAIIEKGFTKEKILGLLV